MRSRQGHMPVLHGAGMDNDGFQARLPIWPRLLGAGRTRCGEPDTSKHESYKHKVLMAKRMRLHCQTPFVEMLVAPCGADAP